VGAVPGIRLVDKPAGMTSHDVVDVARRRLARRRIGHGGTLDPMATGLLLILVERATRLFDDLQAFPKTYVAEFRLGQRTDTQDRTGRVVAEAPTGRLPLSRTVVEQALAPFRGTIQQTPPMYSALKRGGRPLYELARQGIEVEREAREVTVHALALQAFDGAGGTLDMTVSSGFYVRTLIDDLGEALGVGAHMTALTRTAIGPYRLANAAAPEALA